MANVGGYVENSNSNEPLFHEVGNRIYFVLPQAHETPTTIGAFRCVLICLGTPSGKNQGTMTTRVHIMTTSSGSFGEYIAYTVSLFICMNTPLSELI